jgi:ATP-dependent Clp protease ATP-binding subunit ClpA
MFERYNETARWENIALNGLPLTEAGQRTLAQADRERARRSEDMVGPIHLLAGLLDEEACEAAEILRGSGVILEGVRAALDFPPPHSEEGTNYV